MTGNNAPGSITLSRLAVAYDRRLAVEEVDGTFEAGSLTAVVGPNGAGKSTLVKAIVGLLCPATGRIGRAGIAPQSLAYLPQAAEVDRSFPITVEDTIMLGAWRRIGATRRAGAGLRVEASRALAAVGLVDCGHRCVNALSAGQFQRVLFARLLLQDAAVIVLDEPFTAIDARTTRDLLDLVRRWHGERRTVIAVLHDFNQVREHFPRTLLLARRQIAWGPTTEALSSANLLLARAVAEGWEDRAAEAAA